MLTQSERETVHTMLRTYLNGSDVSNDSNLSVSPQK
jgi:hypothetical protein